MASTDAAPAPAPAPAPAGTRRRSRSQDSNPSARGRRPSLASKDGDAEPEPPKDEIKEMLGLSYYEVLLHERQKLGLASVSRIIYVQRLPDGVGADAIVAKTTEIWEGLRAALPKSPYAGLPDMDVTGLMLAHPTAVVHIFETKCPNALDFLVKLRECTDVVDETKTRILMDNEDCPARKFADWRAQAATAKAEEFEITDGDDSCDLAWAVYQDLLKIEELCGKRGERDAVAAAPDHVPSAARVAALADSDHWFDLKEFCEFYTDPIHVTLESEQVWPVQKFEDITGYLKDVEPEE